MLVWIRYARIEIKIDIQTVFNERQYTRSDILRYSICEYLCSGFVESSRFRWILRKYDGRGVRWPLLLTKNQSKIYLPSEIPVLSVPWERLIWIQSLSSRSQIRRSIVEYAKVADLSWGENFAPRPMEAAWCYSQFLEQYSDQGSPYRSDELS